MHVITHFLAGWTLADSVGLERRDRVFVATLRERWRRMGLSGCRSR